MDISTRTVLKRTLATTNTHVELDHMTTMTEQWGDVSIDVSAYYDYDIAEIPVDPSISEDDKIAMRHTHLYLESDNSSTYFKDLYQYYIDNNLYPVTNFFKGGPSSGDDIEPIPDASIDSLADGPGADVVAPIPNASIDSLRDL